jgi:hypothetical protein
MKERAKASCLGRLMRLALLAALGFAGLWWWQLAEDLAALERTRDALRERLTRARAADERLAQVPEADVLIGMPVALTGKLARQLTQSLLDQVQISLRDIRVRKDGVVRTKLLLGTIQPGRYSLDLVLHEAQALLQPGAPRVDFQGRRLGITVPVTVAQGQGRGTVKVDWDSQGLGKVVCEDFSLTQAVAASVVPRTYDVVGSFVLSVEDGALVARPDFPDIVLRVGVEPDEATWKAIDRAIEERSWKCEAVIKKVNVPRLLKDVFERGFEVRIPERFFKPVRLPAAVQQSVTFGGKPYALDAQFFDLRLTPQILWYGANVEVSAVAPVAMPEPPSEPQS